LREGTLLAQPFDLARMEVAGEAVPVAEKVGAFLGFGFFSASANGTLVYLSGANDQNLELTLFDRQGKSLGRLDPPGVFQGAPAFSPDGKQLAVSRRIPGGSKGNLWLLDLTRNGAATKFTFVSALDFDPVWSPDGSRIVFSSDRDGVRNLYGKLASGARDEEILLKSDRPKVPSSWSRDGRFLLYTVVEPKTSSDVWVLPDPGGKPRAGKPVLFQGTAANETGGQFSPDGRWIAYVSDEAGRLEVYVREFILGPDGQPEPTAHRLVSNGGGSVPRWRDDGNELLYLAPNRKTVMSVEISTQPVFRAAPPAVLFSLPVAMIGPVAASPDGKRFVAVMPPQQNGPQAFTVVENFTAALKR
jgi:Tol biopolymer transport system component